MSLLKPKGKQLIIVSVIYLSFTSILVKSLVDNGKEIGYRVLGIYLFGDSLFYLLKYLEMTQI